MTEPVDVTPAGDPSPRRRRGRLGCLAVLLMVAGLLVAIYFYLASVAERDLRQAIAEADRLEPAGWRLAEIEAARRQVPDERNAALVCLKVQPLIPGNWPLPHPEPVAPPPTPPPGEDAETDGPPVPGLPLPGLPPGAMPAPQEQPGCEERLGNLPRPVLMDAGLLRELQLNLKAVEPARDEARKLASLTDGRFPIQWAPDFISTMVTTQAARPVIRLLQLEAILQVQEGRTDEACGTLHRMFVVSRAIGDEPILISMLIRVACQAITAGTLERVLALGEPTAADLEGLQKLLEEEAAEPTFLNAVRGERAVMHELMQAIKSGQVKLGPLAGATGMGGGGLAGRLANTAGPALARRSHPRLLRLMNELVEAARLPPEQQAAPMAAHEAHVRQAVAGNDILIRMLLPAVAKCGEAYRRGQGTLRCAVAAVALERFRREQGHWPDELDELVPRYLAALPVDPGDARPLRYRRTTDGVLVYWVGLDGKDDGGAVGSRPGLPLGKDQGFRHWDVASRRQPPREVLADPAETPPDPPGEMALPGANPEL